VVRKRDPNKKKTLWGALPEKAATLRGREEERTQKKKKKKKKRKKTKKRKNIDRDGVWDTSDVTKYK